MSKRNLKKGFTLIEIIVVVVILGLLITFLGPKIFSRVDDAKVLKAKNDIKAMESALKLYKLDTGGYPTTEQGLNALIVMPDTDPIPRGWKPGGYLEAAEIPQDPWNHNFIYRSPSEIEGFDYEIISLGADGKEGGEGYDADIKSFELK